MAREYKISLSYGELRTLKKLVQHQRDLAAELGTIRDLEELLDHLEMPM